MLFSKTQIDRLGDRLKGGSHTESDLRLLDDYRRSFGEAYQDVVRTIRQRGEFPTGRLAKSTVSVVDKLRRESIRLSQMQDIAGCRVVVVNVAEQEQFVASFIADFPRASVLDRRAKPTYGYRAVHIIAEILGKPIEIQVRSSLQHLWAEISEKSSDVLDPTIKYGGGTDRWREFLTGTSKLVASYEEREKQWFHIAADWGVYVAALEKLKKATEGLPQRQVPDHKVQELRGMLADETREMERAEHEDQEMKKERVRQWKVIAEVLREAITFLDELKGQKQ